MNRASLAAIIAHELGKSVTYKPGYTLRFSAVGRQIVFHLEARTDDSLSGRPDTAIAYTHVINVPIIPTQPGIHEVDAAVRFVLHETRGALHKFEKHESDEWLQVNGEQFRPPHKHYEDGDQ